MLFVSIKRNKRRGVRNYLYISWLIKSNNVRLIAFGEERIGLSRKKVEKNLFRQLDRTTVANRVIRVVGESTFTLILIFAQVVGMDSHT